MSAVQTAPVITRSGNTPATRRKLFVNIPVADLQRSIVFFEALGFTFNPQFTDAAATCMLVGEDAYFMLLTRDFMETFTSTPIADPAQTTGALYAISVGSRAEVDALVEAAIASGGRAAGKQKDHGFMYQWGFHDLDGHHWEVFWMDEASA